jgi:hypothetical protein
MIDYDPLCARVFERMLRTLWVNARFLRPKQMWGTHSSLRIKRLRGCLCYKRKGNPEMVCKDINCLHQAISFSCLITVYLI